MQTNLDISYDKMYENPPVIPKEDFFSPKEVLQMIADGVDPNVNNYDYIYERRLPDGDWNETPVRTGVMLFQSYTSEVIPAILKNIVPVFLPNSNKIENYEMTND